MGDKLRRQTKNNWQTIRHQTGQVYEGKIEWLVLLDAELKRRVGNASTTLSKLTKRVLENKYITKISVYKACVVSTLL